jgi:DNA/RNA-binding domain of Phe-tRNA-synthetase-like protein
MGDEGVFQISDECADLGLVAAILVCRNVAVGEPSTRLRESTRAVAEQVQKDFGTSAAIRTAPEIVAFRTLYEMVGVNPNREPPACQRLIEMAWKRGDLSRINNLVDAYNMVSVDCRLSLGAHDLATVALPIRLAVAVDDTPFTPLGAYGPGHVRRGEFGYVDARDRVICRLDLVQAEFSKITERTSDVVLIVEGIRAAHDPRLFERAAGALGRLVREECRGSAEIVVWPFD